MFSSTSAFIHFIALFSPLSQGKDMGFFNPQKVKTVGKVAPFLDLVDNEQKHSCQNTLVLFVDSWWIQVA